MTILRNIDRYSEKLIIALFMITMCLLIFVQVVSRYVFGDSVTWTEELSRYMFIWLVFLTIGVGFKENKHISIDIVLDLFPKIIQKAIRQITYLAMLGLSALFVWEGYILVLQMQMYGQTSPNLEIPMWWVYLSLPVGFLLSVVRLIQASFKLWMHNNEEEN